MKKPKICILCKHIDMDFGSPGYSECTPGSDWDFRCEKDMWEMSGCRTTEEEYRRCILMAQNCKLFEQDPAAEE